jgi:hypothetical protein
MSSCESNAIDFTALDCLGQCQYLYNQYIALMTGNSTPIRVRYKDMWTEVRNPTSGDMDRIRELYITLWSNCPEAQCELPDLSKGAQVRRGPPATGIFHDVRDHQTHRLYPYASSRKRY